MDGIERHAAAVRFVDQWHALVRAAGSADGQHPRRQYLA
jgi:hypothetical protein